MEIKKGPVHRSFDVIGDIAVVNFGGKVKRSHAVEFAKRVILNNKHIKSVFMKVGKIEGEERKSKLRFLYGENRSLARHAENGCVFDVDVKKVFFTPRLSSERKRILKQVKKGEDVLDMFCGVGPFSIPIAKVANSVYAVDINKDAIRLLEKNTKLNRIDNIVPMCMDARKLPAKVKSKFDRIIMNLPAKAIDFLPYAVKMCKARCTIHLYSFVYLKDGRKSVKDAEKEIRKKIVGVKVKSIRSIKAGEVAPHMLRMCFDVVIEKH